MSKGIRVTVEDLETGVAESKVIGPGDFLFIPVAPCYLGSAQRYPKAGTTMLTVKYHRPQPTEEVPQKNELAEVLRLIERHDTDYVHRYGLVWRALSLAVTAGHAAGVRIDPAEPEWPVVYIELPTGQVSWHMPQFATEWDGHDTAEKYRRARAFSQT